MLTNDERDRYERQLLLEGFGEQGQARLGAARVLVVGAGGLGSPVLNYLVAAGVGTIGLGDFDTVAASNLQRQILHWTRDVGRTKVDSAAEKLAELNPTVTLVPHADKVTAANVVETVRGYDVVVDAVDNLTARYLITDACFFEGIPVVEGAVLSYDGLLMTILPGRSACYRCLYPEPPLDVVLPTTAELGILGATAGVIGTLQALEVVKLLTGTGSVLADRLVQFDGRTTTFREIPWPRQSTCPLCGDEPTVTHPVEYRLRRAGGEAPA